MSLLLDPLQFSFITRALIAAVIVGIVCSVLGTFVVLRGMAFFGDALAHTILPGVVIAFLLGWPLAIGALIFGILTALGIGVLTERGTLKEDTAIGVVFAGLFALGVALLSMSGSYTIDLAHFLFGNLLGVTAVDLWVIAGLGAVVMLVVFLFFKEFMVISFDPAAGRHLAPADHLLALPAAGADRRDHCHRPAGRGHRPHAGHVRHPGGDCLLADAVACRR